MRLITLDTRDPKLSFIPKMKRAAAGGLEAHQLPLFYCWPCGGSPTYRLEPTGQVTVMGRSSTGPEKDFPYPDYPGSFAERSAALALIPTAIQRSIQQANAGTLDSGVKVGRALTRHMRPNHQVGGIPYLVQGDPEASPCPQCNAVMPILAAASTESGGNKPFASDPFMQVVFEYCASCQIVSGWHQSD